MITNGVDYDPVDPTAPDDTLPRGSIKVLYVKISCFSD